MKEREEREQQKQLAREEREQRKAHQSNPDGSGEDKGAENRKLFQDLINIQIPQDHQAGYNTVYAFQTPPVNPGLLGSSHNYGYSIPPWLQGATWPTPNVCNSTQPGQTSVSNPTRLGNEGNQPPHT